MSFWEQFVCTNTFHCYIYAESSTMAKQGAKTLWVDGPFALIKPSKSGDKVLP